MQAHNILDAVANPLIFIAILRWGVSLLHLSRTSSIGRAADS